MQHLKPILTGTVTALIMLACANGQAQTVYRIVGQDGRVTFSDQPPVAAAKVTAQSANGRAVDANPQNSSLPYTLRQIVARYPVTLYSSAGCVPCNAGRLMLQGRGIPYTEHTISTGEDVEALQRLSGDKTLPFLTIGGQKLKGYSEAEWTQFLNAANYPTTSQLPGNFKHAPASPLVSAKKLAPAAAQARETTEEPTPEGAAAASAAPAASPSPSNPAGIKF